MSDDRWPEFRPRRSAGRKGLSLGLVVLAVLLGPAVSPAGTETETTTLPSGRHVWFDVNGEPLPFQSDAEVIGFLQAARVEDRNPIERGVAGAEKIVLTLNGLSVDSHSVVQGQPVGRRLTTER